MQRYVLKSLLTCCVPYLKLHSLIVDVQCFDLESAPIVGTNISFQEFSTNWRIRDDLSTAELPMRRILNKWPYSDEAVDEFDIIVRGVFQYQRICTLCKKNRTLLFIMIIRLIHNVILSIINNISSIWKAFQ